MAGTPDEVWKLIRRSDDLVKYAPNRDPAVARKQAREILDQASAGLEELADPKAAEALREQIKIRYEDLGAE